MPDYVVVYQIGREKRKETLNNQAKQRSSKDSS